MSDAINFDQVTFFAFVNRYNIAVSKNEKEFLFQGKEVLTSYAKLLIDEFSDKFKAKNKAVIELTEEYYYELNNLYQVAASTNQSHVLFQGERMPVGVVESVLRDTAHLFGANEKANDVTYVCPHCNKELHMAPHVRMHPEQYDWAVCDKCGAVLRNNEDMTKRLSTAAELERLRTEMPQEYAQLMQVAQHIKESRKNIN